MKGIITAALVSLLLTSCANFQKMDMTLGMMKGKDKSLPFKVLGYPDSSYKLDSDVVYVWSRSQGGVLAMPTSSTNTMMIDGKYATSTSYGTVYAPTSYECRIRVFPDHGG